MVWAFLFQEEEISCISSRLYISEKTVHRVVDLYLSCVPKQAELCPFEELIRSQKHTDPRFYV